MNEYDQTFNPNILIGHYDLISWFSDFALYLNTEWVYDHYVPPTEGGGHIVFGAVPVGVGVGVSVGVRVGVRVRVASFLRDIF